MNLGKSPTASDEEKCLENKKPKIQCKSTTSDQSEERNFIRNSSNLVEFNSQWNQVVRMFSSCHCTLPDLAVSAAVTMYQCLAQKALLNED